MPFVLSNAAQTFQRLMDSLFRDFPFIFVYLDDMLIFSRSRSEHLSHLDTVLAVLAEMASTSTQPSANLLSQR
jgi:hypothetical protein